MSQSIPLGSRRCSWQRSPSASPAGPGRGSHTHQRPRVHPRVAAAPHSSRRAEPPFAVSFSRSRLSSSSRHTASIRGRSSGSIFTNPFEISPAADAHQVTSRPLHHVRGSSSTSRGLWLVLVCCLLACLWWCRNRRLLSASTSCCCLVTSCCSVPPL
uniref:Uncharacterized protein n=1 Tax=Arundo donax TaxID=35708 RepID=A0A0A9EZP6_ARUDO